MSVDDLFEVFLGRIDAAEHLALQTAVFVRDDVVDQFGHLEVSGSRIVQAPLVAQVAGRTEEDAADGGPRRHGDLRTGAALRTDVVVGDAQAIGHIQMQQNALQLVGRIIEDDLLEGVIRLGQLLSIVQTDAEIEQIAAGQTFPLIPAVDILRAMNNVADCIARQGNGAPRHRTVSPHT